MMMKSLELIIVLMMFMMSIRRTIIKQLIQKLLIQKKSNKSSRDFYNLILFVVVIFYLLIYMYFQYVMYQLQFSNIINNINIIIAFHFVERSIKCSVVQITFPPCYGCVTRGAMSTEIQYVDRLKIRGYPIITRGINLINFYQIIYNLYCTIFINKFAIFYN